MSVITDMSFLRNDNFELKTIDLKLVTTLWRHHCRHLLVRTKKGSSFPEGKFKLFIGV